jgi:hypothetical protein
MPLFHSCEETNKGLKRALAKRKHIQKNRKVTDDYIWSLFEKERLLPRLTRRISKNPRSDLKTPSTPPAAK